MTRNDLQKQEEKKKVQALPAIIFKQIDNFSTHSVGGREQNVEVDGKT